MPWFKVDDSFYGHPKRAGVSLSALGLWTVAGCWSAQQLSDGFVPRAMLPMLGGRARDALELVTSGLWVLKDDGWQFHDWPDYQPSRVQVMAEREAERERKRKGRETQQKRREGTT